ncbi:04ce4f9a-bec6-4645-9fa8-2a542d517cb5 [Sclerotinia trifoliorum]|uniref:04ce4f9a-bec6-4645-9fa8-2a542d517cb5 n=1 Tax=Sclerotinia trifoliorum TaxID=28548 RepID=A0A8H2VLU9_9HELO|nr:04ce4f9a-bec6-4645-9fa8-2a542d517cb5 [Sclerotinia trifoliorum]
MSYSTYYSESLTWQEKLDLRCREAQIQPPIFQIVSDKRGGRTAWSSTVFVSGQNIPARYWYDGQNVNTMKEDAAEVAFIRLTGSSPTSPIQGRGGW